MNMNLTLRLLLLTALLAAAQPVRAYEGFFPKGITAQRLLRLADLKLDQGGGGAQAKVGLGVEPNGQPLLLINDVFFNVPSGAGSKTLTPVRVKAPDGIQSFAVMDDGAVLAVSGRFLGAVIPNGFQKIVKLPGNRMKIAAATGDACYLYGGETPAQKGSLYLYGKGRKLIRLVKSPRAITAVAGLGDATFFSTGTSLFLLKAGKPAVLVFEADSEISSLAVDWPRGVFYSTARDVGYVSGPGRSYRFIRGEGAKLFVQNNQVFLFLRNSGELVKCGPISKFADLSSDFENAKKRKK
jgi:hypothetical protein